MPPKRADPGAQPGGVKGDGVGIAQQEQVQSRDETGKTHQRVKRQGSKPVDQQKQPGNENKAPVCQEQVYQVYFKPFTCQPAPIGHGLFLMLMPNKQPVAEILLQVNRRDPGLAHPLHKFPVGRVFNVEQEHPAHNV